VREQWWVVVAVVPCGPIYKPDGQMGTGTLANELYVCTQLSRGARENVPCWVAHGPGLSSRPPPLAQLTLLVLPPQLARIKSWQMKVGAGRP